MEKRNKVILAGLVLLGLAVTLAVYLVWPRNHLEVQVRETKMCPNGKWNAVVELEVYNSGWVVNDAVYAVRLKGPAQKDRFGDLVMNVPVSYPDPEPSVDWNEGTLVVTLTHHQKYQYLANPVSGVPIDVQQK